MTEIEEKLKKIFENITKVKWDLLKPVNLGNRECERCGEIAQWLCGYSKEHVLCMNCATIWLDPEGLPGAVGKVLWEKIYQKFLRKGDMEFLTYRNRMIKRWIGVE